eukprot:scaffold115781_cov48-Phaeocystis_antarctica.AAC.2
MKGERSTGAAGAAAAAGCGTPFICVTVASAASSASAGTSEVWRVAHSTATRRTKVSTSRPLAQRGAATSRSMQSGEPLLHELLLGDLGGGGRAEVGEIDDVGDPALKAGVDLVEQLRHLARVACEDDDHLAAESFLREQRHDLVHGLLHVRAAERVIEPIGLVDEED